MLLTTCGVVGLSATGVHKIIGRQRAKDSQAVLDSPAADSDRGTQP